MAYKRIFDNEFGELVLWNLSVTLKRLLIRPYNVSDIQNQKLNYSDQSQTD